MGGKAGKVEFASEVNRDFIGDGHFKGQFLRFVVYRRLDVFIVYKELLRCHRDQNLSPSRAIFGESVALEIEGVDGLV
jgi:hypothetical protein